MQARLSANDLACRRGDRVLFRGLSLTLEAGSACHVTGANGIGKSSLLRIIAGLLNPIAGTVSVDGPIGLVDERPALDPDMPLGRALGVWSRIDGAEDQSANFKTLGIDELLDIPVCYLSTGQRKRATFARLIAQDASVWLLDEPLNGLDSDALDVITGLIDEHLKKGGIAVIASHQPIAIEGLQRLALERFTP